MMRIGSARVRLMGAAVLLSALVGVSAVRAAAVARKPFIDFSKALAASLNRHDASLFVRHFDRKAFVARLVGATHVPADRRAMVLTYARQAAAGMGKVILNKLGKKGRIKFIRLGSGGSAGARMMSGVFRVDLGTRGLDYWRMEMTAGKTGDVRIVDWINYATGAAVSRGMADVFTLMLGDDPKSQATAGHGQSAQPSNRWVLVGFFAAFRKARYQTALMLYDELPQWMKRDRYIQIARLRAAKAVGSSKYQEMLSDLAKTYGSDKRMSLALVDHYIYAKNYARAQTMVDRVTKMVGKDAGLDGLHANIAYRAGHFRRAVRYCRRAIREDPDYEDTYWTLLNTLVADGHYDDAVLVLRILDGKFGHTLNVKAVKHMPGFAGFTQSRQYQAWVQ